jgi:hypothetical protein
MLASGEEWPVALAPSPWRLPADGLEGLGALRQAQWAMATDLGRITRGPGACQQRPAGMRVPGLGERALAAARTAGRCRRRPASGTHPLSGGIKAGQVPQCGHGGDGDGAREPAQGLEGLDPWRQAPGMPRLWQGLRETLEAFGVPGHGQDVCLEDDGLGRCGADPVREPAPLGWPPSGLASRASVVPQPEGCEAPCGALEIAERLLTCAPEVPHGVVLPVRDRDGGQFASAHEAGELGRVTASGVPPGTGLLGHQGGGPHLADLVFCA